MNTKTIGAIVLVIVLLVLALQNTAMVPVQLYFWSVHLSTALLIAVAAAAGVLAGLFLGSRPGARRS